MTYKHITADKYGKITTAAKAVSALETGNRNETKAYNRFILDTIWLGIHSRDVAKLPKAYTIILCEKENLGTSKWGDWINVVKTMKVTATMTMRETEHNYYYKDGYHEYKIQKYNIIAYVW